MKEVKYLAILPLITLSMSLAGCGGPNPKGTGAEYYKTYGEQIEDSKIIAKIRSNFRNNPSIPADLIHVSIDRNIVQLSGFVRTPAEANLTILTTRNTPGVKDVIDNIIVLSDPEYAARRGTAEAYNTRR